MTNQTEKSCQWVPASLCLFCHDACGSFRGEIKHLDSFQTNICSWSLCVSPHKSRFYFKINKEDCKVRKLNLDCHQMMSQSLTKLPHYYTYPVSALKIRVNNGQISLEIIAVMWIFLKLFICLFIHLFWVSFHEDLGWITKQMLLGIFTEYKSLTDLKYPATMTVSCSYVSLAWQTDEIVKDGAKEDS